MLATIVSVIALLWFWGLYRGNPEITKKAKTNFMKHRRQGLCIIVGLTTAQILAVVLIPGVNLEVVVNRVLYQTLAVFMCCCILE